MTNIYTVQTRSEETGLNFYSSSNLESALVEAKLAAEKDSSIWKISYIDETGNSVRLVKNEENEWENQPLTLS